MLWRTMCICLHRYYNASNLSDRLTAFKALEGTPAYNRTLAHFESTYSSKPMALAKWFRVQASSDQPNNTNAVRGLMQHATFDASEYAICSAVLMGFSDSVVNFHAADGSGYRFLADAVLQVRHNGRAVWLAASCWCCAVHTVATILSSYVRQKYEAAQLVASCWWCGVHAVEWDRSAGGCKL